MAYVVTDACVKDFRCVDDCAVDAISPKKDDPRAEAATQVYINQDECIECGSCTSICENDAIVLADDLPAEKQQFIEKNKAFFQ